MRREVLFLIVVVLLASPAVLAEPACPPSYDIVGDSVSFGYSVAIIGDIGNESTSAADGYDDFVVGAPVWGHSFGKVFVYSGADGAEIRTHTGNQNTSRLGWSICGADFNGDGRPDYVVGSYSQGSGHDGRITIWSGVADSILFYYQSTADEWCGYSVTNLGDLHYPTDGKDDIVVGCPKYSAGSYTNGGRVLLFAGDTALTRPPVGWIEGTSPNQQFGMHVAGLGNIDGDEDDRPDFAVSSIGGDVIIYSGGVWYDTLLRVPHSLVVEGVGDLGSPGDTTKDGHADFVVGYVSNNNAVVFSGYKSSYGPTEYADTMFVLTVDNSEGLGYRVAGGGLIDSGSVPDILVTEKGAYGVRNSFVHVFSGVDGSLLFSHDGGGKNNTFGTGLSCGGDTDSSGLDNILVGQNVPGKVYLYSCTDSDGDGWFDPEDNCPDVYNPSQENSDGDDVGDSCDNCIIVDNANQANDDADTLGNACDNCPDDTNNDQADGDSDDVGNVCDNCLTDANSNQADDDSDDVGNVCDNCPADSNYNQANSDADTLGNVCDNCPDDTNNDQDDGDGDGVGDVCDNCEDEPNPSQADWDDDDIGNACECDTNRWQCCDDGWLHREPGDIDNDPDTSLDIADLVYLVDYQFTGGPPPLPFILAADYDLDTLVGISDLVLLVDFMFDSGPPPLDACNPPPKSGRSSMRRYSGSGHAASAEAVGTITSTFDGLYTIIEINSSIDLKAIELELKCDDKADITSLPADIELFSNNSHGTARVGLLDMEGKVRIKAGVTSIMVVTGEAQLITAVGVNEDRHLVGLTVESAQKEVTVPDNYSLSQNFPNPFNPITEISFSLPTPSAVKLEIFNVMGQKVATLVNSHLEAGNHSFVWDGSDVASGVYLYRFQAGDYVASKKMVLMK